MARARLQNMDQYIPAAGYALGILYCCCAGCFSVWCGRRLDYPRAYDDDGPLAGERKRDVCNDHPLTSKTEQGDLRAEPDAGEEEPNLCEEDARLTVARKLWRHYMKEPLRWWTRGHGRLLRWRQGTSTRATLKSATGRHLLLQKENGRLTSSSSAGQNTPLLSPESR
jgi:hypothetical protein